MLLLLSGLVLFASFHKEDCATDQHQRQPCPHDTSDCKMHAGLDGRVVDPLLHLFRDNVVLIQLTLLLLL